MLLIADAQMWAKYQGYTLRTINDNSYAVLFGDRPLGALVRTAGGYKFVTECSVTAPDAAYEENTSDTFMSRSFGLSHILPIEADRCTRGTDGLALPGNVSGTGQLERVSDCNYWLPYAAEHYQLSRNIRDYVLIPIPAIFSDLPNTNGDGLSLKEMLRFDPELGMQMYKTFKGKGTFLEHNNKDITQAKGLILDAFLRPVPFNTKYYKIVLLLAYDRTKDSQLAQEILSKSSNAYSVGFYYTSYSCSVCNTRVGKGVNVRPCGHTQMGRPTYKQDDGRIVYRRCENAQGFECSSVNTPAFCSAIGPHVYDVRNF